MALFGPVALWKTWGSLLARGTDAFLWSNNISKCMNGFCDIPTFRVSRPCWSVRFYAFLKAAINPLRVWRSYSGLISGPSSGWSVLLRNGAGLLFSMIPKIKSCGFSTQLPRSRRSGRFSNIPRRRKVPGLKGGKKMSRLSLRKRLTICMPTK